MSRQGARLHLEAPADSLSPRFSLLVSAAEPMLDCEQVWRDGERVGVRFH
jgi:hypothetical protein